MRIEPNVIKAAAVCAAVKDIRFYLNGVRIQSDGKKAYVIGSDGHRVFVYRVQGDINWTGDTMLSGDILKMAMSSKLPVLIDDEGILITWTRVPHPTVEAIGKYPDWRRIVPVQVYPDDENVSHFNPEYQGDIAKVAKALKVKPYDTRMHQSGDNAGIVTFDQEPCFMVLMPVRTAQMVESFQINTIL